MLLRLVTRNVLRRPIRYGLIIASVALGVAAITAVFIFVDGLRITFSEVSNDSEVGYDLAVRAESPFGGGSAAGQVPLDVPEELASIDGAGVQPRVVDFSVVAVDADGEGALANNTSNIGLNWESNNPQAPTKLAEGRPPTASDEFALDIDAFNEGNFVFDETYVINTPSGSTQMKLVGTFKYLDAETGNSLGARVVAFETTTAVDLLNGGTGYDDVIVSTSGDPVVLLNQVEQLLSARDDSLKTRTQQELIEERQKGFGQILKILRTILMGFASVILLVSCFLIYNIFTITFSQRTKEIGALRALGASRSQISRVLLGEALVIGIVATGIGVAAGPPGARLLRLSLNQFGFPGSSPLPLAPRTLGLAVAVGIFVTLIAGVWPALRSRRISPMAALRNITTDLEPARNIPIGIICLVISGGLTASLYLARGWELLVAIPISTALFGFLGVRLFGRPGRTVAPYMLLGYSIWILATVWFGTYSLEETFALLGTGAILTVLAVSKVSASSARPFSFIVGHYPTAGVIWLCGIAVALLSGLTLPNFLAEPNPLVEPSAETDQSGPNMAYLVTISFGLAILAYALLRTTRGAVGISGRLGRRNAARSPQRTAATSTALMVGLALVTAVSIIGDSIKSSVNQTLTSSLTADWLVRGPQTGDQALPFSSTAADQLQTVDEASDVATYRFSAAAFTAVIPTTTSGLSLDEVSTSVPRLFEILEDEDATQLQDLETELGASINVEPALGTEHSKISSHVKPGFIERDDSLAKDSNGIYLEAEAAERSGLSLGSSFVAVFSDGEAEKMVVTGIYTDGLLLGERVIDTSQWTRHLPTGTSSFLTVTTAEGVNPESAREAMETSLRAEFPNLLLQDRSEVGAEAERQIDRTLATVNALLLFAGLMAVLGITTALSLSVFERKGEVALLRAVGTKRHQVRWAIRWEGIIVSLFGGFFGLAVGLGLGVLVAYKLPNYLITTTSIPFKQLFVYITLVALSGMVAASLPAISAGRVRILEALDFT